MNNQWFESRNLRVLTYQDTAITKVQESLEQREITVLAACPSAGKTLMTIYMMEEWLHQNPNHKIMVLAHGTTILRTQFHDVLKEVNPAYYCFEAKWLWKKLKMLKTNNVLGQYYLTDLVQIAMQEKTKIESINIKPKEALGINSKEELEILEKLAPEI